MSEAAPDPSPASAGVRLIAAALAATLTGCAGTLDIASVSALGTAALSAKPTVSEVVRSQASVQETYIRIARGANRCWFGPRGHYRDGYVFYADLEAGPRGSAADVTVHERVKGGDRPWGLKALRITITPSGEQADVTVTNLKMADADATRMAGDVQRFVRGEEECGAVPATTATATAVAPEPTPAATAGAPPAKPAR